MSDSPLNFFIPDTPQMARNLRAKLLEEHHKLLGQLGAGIAQDWGDYKYKAGVAQGLSLAIRLCAEAEKELRN